jgi:hypothetical protein
MEPPPYEGSGWYEDDGQDTPCVPYPHEILNLGGFRWLLQDGRVIALPESEHEWATQTATIAVSEEEDPQTAVGSRWGAGVYVNRRTRAYWEDRAAVSGHTLDELLASG